MKNKFYRVLLFLIPTICNVNLIAQYELAVLSSLFLATRYIIRTQDNDSVKWVYDQYDQNSHAFTKNTHFIENKEFFTQLIQDHIVKLKKQKITNSKTLRKAKLAKSILFFALAGYCDSLCTDLFVNPTKDSQKTDIDLLAALCTASRFITCVISLYKGITHLISSLRYQASIPEKIKRDKNILKIIQEDSQDMISDNTLVS
ncbi:hypothetical protein KG892_00255 [Vermiphilus pyriformis]|jgi:hypothetical protein|uniref:Uncharacterized protein n=1 Tax=candidate division TM6 bacterium JCVI TM6SC1 TaxID=1306947 RepID=A0A0D2K4D0_9BACT|nr:hypothetical protein J120_04255 [candidate division TM6 bacterium JCVI TM6SC1]UNE35452.1 MAG: hypothetical protein KG892_00255 [Vermiphilus pyriformis]